MVDIFRTVLLNVWVGIIYDSSITLRFTVGQVSSNKHLIHCPNCTQKCVVNYTNLRYKILFI
jgi:hypothetical protein